VAYSFIGEAASAGIAEYTATGDFAAVARGAAARRQALVERVAEELRSGKADVASVRVSGGLRAREGRALRRGGRGRVRRAVGLRRGPGVRRRGPAGPGGPGRRRRGRLGGGEERPPGGPRGQGYPAAPTQPRARGPDAAALRPLFARVLPHVFARPTFFALLDVFEVFRRRGGRGSSQAYSGEDRSRIEAFLDTIDRTPVMKRCRAEAANLKGRALSGGEWRAVLWRIWFELPSEGRCGFEHVFVGEASVDARGREVVGGLHNWFKFYLEEQRGAAQYLGQRYPGRGKAAAGLNPRFVSGCFTWDLEGRHLVKDVGGFFVGVSPEWQVAVATTAFLETAAPGVALLRKWSRDPASRDEGFVRVAKFGTHVYRLAVYRGEGERLTTFYATQLGRWDARARAELDEQLTTSELQQRLPAVLVLHGFADEPELLACAASVAASGALTLREAWGRRAEESINKHARVYIELRDRMTTIESQLIAGFGEAKEKALLANILEAQSPVDSASTRRSLPSLARRSKGKSSSSSNGRFTGGCIYENCADPCNAWICVLRPPTLARDMLRNMHTQVLPRLPSHIKPPTEVNTHDLHKALSVSFGNATDAKAFLDSVKTNGLAFKTGILFFTKNGEVTIVPALVGELDSPATIAPDSAAFESLLTGEEQTAAMATSVLE
ncbi:unnamed protein product, partial [Prorocentrum cordatum]